MVKYYMCRKCNTELLDMEQEMRFRYVKQHSNVQVGEEEDCCEWEHAEMQYCPHCEEAYGSWDEEFVYVVER